MIADIRHALRLIRTAPIFAASIVLTAALGIGATTAMFSVVNAVLLRPLPFDHPERLYQIAEKNDRLHLPVFAASALNFLSWREQIDRFERIGAVGFGTYTLSGRGDAEQFTGFRISPSVMRILGLRPVLGGDFADADESPSAPPVAMIGEGLWRRRFGGDPTLVGQALTINGAPTTIVGIAPAELAVLTAGGDIWSPLTIGIAKEQRLNHLITVVGRVKPGVTVQQAQTEMNTIASRVREQFPEMKDWGIHLVTFRDMFVSPQLQTALLVLLAAVAVVLLIACANITNLLLVRGAARQRELAVRAAIGASRFAVVRHMLVESVTLSALGGMAGIMIAVGGVRAINELLLPTVLPRHEVVVDATVVGFACLVTIGTGLLFGGLPAYRAARGDLNAILRHGGRGSSGAGLSTRNVLAATELALATLLLIGAGLLVETLFQLQHVRLGFEPRRVLTFQLAPPSSRYTTDQSMALYRRLVPTLREVPGVRSVGLSSGVPFGAGATTRTPTAGLNPTAVPPDTAIPIDWRVVSPGFFQTMGMTLERGRDFDDRDTPSALSTAVVSESTARTFWGDDDPIGRVVRIVATGRDFTIVGVVNDARMSALDQELPAMYFSSHARSWPTMDVAVRIDGAPEAIVPAVRRKVRDLDPNLPLSQVRMMDEWVARSANEPRLNATLVGVFAGGALLLAALGIYGVIAYSVSQRTREIGLRMALGAPRDAVVRLVVGEGVTIGGAGIALGILIALALARALSTLVFGVDVRDPAIYVGVAVLLTIVSLTATFVPARKASRVDPMIALRQD